MTKALLLGMFLATSMWAHAQSADPAMEDEIVASTDIVGHFCADRYPAMKDLPARLTAEAGPDERAALQRVQADPKFVADRAEKMKLMAQGSPKEVQALCHSLADLPKGGIYADMRAEMMVDTLVSFYPGVVKQGAEEFKRAKPEDRALVLNHLVEGLVDGHSDDIMRGRITDAFAALGPEANGASGALKNVILRSAKGLPVSSQEVPLDKPLKSGSMVSNSATFTTDSSGEIFDTAFKILGGMKPAPIATLCELLTIPDKKVQTRAKQEMDTAKLPAASCPK